MRLESWELTCRDLSFEKAKISLQDSCPAAWFCSFEVLLPPSLPFPFPLPFPRSPLCCRLCPKHRTQKYEFKRGTAHVLMPFLVWFSEIFRKNLWKPLKTPENHLKTSENHLKTSENQVWEGWFSMVFRWFSDGFQGFSRIFKGFQRFSGVFRWFSGVFRWFSGVLDEISKIIPPLAPRTWRF